MRKTEHKQNNLETPCQVISEETQDIVLGTTRDVVRTLLFVFLRKILGCNSKPIIKRQGLVRLLGMKILRGYTEAPIGYYGLE